MKKILLPALLMISLAGAIRAGQREYHGRYIDRRRALEILKDCKKGNIGLDCEYAAWHLIKLYHQGRNDVLAPLLDLGPQSAGALSGLLAAFYAELLTKRTNIFLAALAPRPESDQHAIAKLAMLAEGSGLAPEKRAEVKANLTRVIAAKSRFSAAARLCLAELEAAR